MPKDLEPQIERSLKDLRTVMANKGIDYHQEFYSPETGLAGLVQTLKSQPWNGVLIGGGLFGHPEMTFFLEQAIHTIHLNAPQAIVLFTHGVSEAPEAVNRWFARSSAAAAG